MILLYISYYQARDYNITEVEIIPEPRINKLIFNEVLVEGEREVHKNLELIFSSEWKKMLSIYR